MKLGLWFMLSLYCMCRAEPVQLPGIQTTEKFEQSSILDKDGKYILFWNFNDTHVTFEVHVKTRGYVGFGISGNGDMFPGDVVVGWVKNGVTHFADRHTTGHSPPVLDQSQDWSLLHGEENDFGTVLKFVRKIDTCDSAEDKIIEEGTVRIIYSFHDNDPVDDNSLLYHGTNRGTKSVSLLSKFHVPDNFPADVKHFDFFNRNYVIPAVSTTYHCVGFMMPDFGGKHHVIKYEPIITPGNELHVHHILVYRCHGYNMSSDGVSGNCYDHRPKALGHCSDVVFAWAIGGQPLYFPEHVGLSIGAQDDPPFYIMETHYDNPTNAAGIVDDSGLRITLTSHLRQHDLGMIELGHQTNFHQVVPPFMENFVTKSYCAPYCINKGLKQMNLNEIKIVGAFQHAHLLGKAIKTRHFRGDQELAPLMNDPNYDFDFQEFRLLKKERSVQPNDRFMVECTYDSRKRTHPTLGGLSTQDEMCLTFVYYYPKIHMAKCLSMPTFDTFHMNANQIRHLGFSLDWTNATARDWFLAKVDSSTVSHSCSGQGLLPQPQSTHVLYKETAPAHTYQAPPSSCANHG